jgi:hypothetical protein
MLILFQMDFKIGPILGGPSVVMVPKGCPQKPLPTNWGVLFNHKDPPIHARQFRESWRAWPHEGRIRRLFMICIQVGIARKFEIIILDVAHVWNYTT